MNAESSRSHAVVILRLDRHVAATAKRKHQHLQSKLNLVDLAGSERITKSGATGETLKEAIAINQSLSMLGNVINALTDARAAAHIPYRSSKLTYLLEESLGGNSRTVMLAACSPSTRSYFETMNTLQYAVSAQTISVGGGGMRAVRVVGCRNGIGLLQEAAPLVKCSLLGRL